MKIGDKIRNVRMLQGLSQENVAAMLGISLMTYGEIERNKKDITLKRVEEIAEALGVSLWDLISSGDSISNFFDHCKGTNVASGKSSFKNIENNYDQRELLHKIALQELQIEKLQTEIKQLKAEKEKAEIEALLYKSK